MILSAAVVAGFFAGLLRARWMRTSWQTPALNHSWLVLVFFLPQLFAFYLPGTRTRMPDLLVSICLVTSLFGLMLFSMINWRLPGMFILSTGLLLNLVAIVANNGLMPLSTVTAAHLLPAQTLQNQEIGHRLGASKDILLAPDTIIFPWLADRFVPPTWFSYRFAFSIGDVFIAIGAFLLLALSIQSGPSLEER